MTGRCRFGDVYACGRAPPDERASCPLLHECTQVIQLECVEEARQEGQHDRGRHNRGPSDQTIGRTFFFAIPVILAVAMALSLGPARPSYAGRAHIGSGPTHRTEEVL